MADASTKGAGMSVYNKVDDIADYHQAVVAQGMKPEGEPEERPPGIGSSRSATRMATGWCSSRRSRAPAASCEHGSMVDAAVGESP